MRELIPNYLEGTKRPSCGWPKLYHIFILELVVASNQKKLKTMKRSKDYQVLLATTAFTGMGKKPADVQHGWEEDGNTTAVVGDRTAIAYDRNVLKFFHFGIKEAPRSNSGSVRAGNREGNVFRTIVLVTGHFFMIIK
ncbi:hypothetical protein TMEN_2935 [Trichophyton mentagrophytes]|nr:hypothetical protein TMEN_2935 [Trichophyton mentagrophytes]